MKTGRRGFFGILAGIGAASVLPKAIKPLPAFPLRSTAPVDWNASTTSCCSISVLVPYQPDSLWVSKGHSV